MQTNLQCCGCPWVRPSLTSGQDDMGLRAWTLGPGCLHLTSGLVTSDESLRFAQLTHLHCEGPKVPTAANCCKN